MPDDSGEVEQEPVEDAPEPEAPEDSEEMPEKEEEDPYSFDTAKKKFSVISCYFPSGSSGEERQQAKFRFLDEFDPYLAALKQTREFILCGDVNIAHKEQDLKNWRGNRKNSGFLPEERAWMTKLFDQTGLVDVYRHLQPQATEAAYAAKGH